MARAPSTPWLGSPPCSRCTWPAASLARSPIPSASFSRASSRLGGPNYLRPCPGPFGVVGSVPGSPHPPSPPASDSPSTSMKTMSCGHAGRFTQIADATDPVRGLTPCQRPPAGAIPPAGRLLTLAFLEALVREDGHDILRRRGPAMFLLDPRDPAVLAKSVEARHRSHHASPVREGPSNSRGRPLGPLEVSAIPKPRG
jgi:hypothetical protein